jgi:hypothetical protein
MNAIPSLLIRNNDDPWSDSVATVMDKEVFERRPERVTKFASTHGVTRERIWLLPVLRRINKLLALPADWDGYGARPVRRDVAMFALAVLQRTMDAASPPAQIVPSSDGGLQLEWHMAGMDIELEIQSPYVAELWVRDRRDGAMDLEQDVKDDLGPLQHALRVLTLRART